MMTKEEIAEAREICNQNTPGFAASKVFVAAARQCWPRALDEIERLQNVLDEIHAVAYTSNPDLDTASIRGILQMTIDAKEK